MNLGWPEIVLIMVFALVLFGPKRLPEIGRQIGRALAEVRKVSREFEREVRSVTGDFEKEISGAKDSFTGVARELEREVRTAYALDDDHSTYLVDRGPKAAEAAPKPDAKPLPAHDGAPPADADHPTEPTDGGPADPRPA